MIASLNAWANDPPLLAEIRKLGITHLRGGMILDRDTRQLNMTPAVAADTVHAIAAAGFAGTAIVWHHDQIDWLLGENGVDRDREYRNWLRSIITIEVGNECNIATNKQMAPGVYADFAAACINRCAELGFAPPYIGGPHNIDNDAAMAWLADVVRILRPASSVPFALHSYVIDPYRYDWRRITDGHMARVRKIIGPARFAITETGLFSMPRKEPKFKIGPFKFGTVTRQWTDPQIAQWATAALDYWRGQGADLMSWYQLNNGDPATNYEESYGIRRFHTAAETAANPSLAYDWLPVAFALGGWK